MTELEGKIGNALEGTPVLGAYLIGSRVRGAARPDSDTDVACLLPAGFQGDLSLIADLTVRLQEAGVPNPDVHLMAEAPLAFQAEAVLHGRRAWAADEEACVRYEARTMLEAFDFQHLLDLQYRIQRRRLMKEGTLGRPGRR